jgi:uncharacterized protein (DUF1330 family)
MAKGYWIARVDVHNMDGYKEYVAQNGAVFAKYGARFLMRSGKRRGRGRLVAADADRRFRARDVRYDS